MHSAISRVLIPSDINLITLPKLAAEIGRSEAIFLQQLHYWLTTNNEIGCILDGKKWIYNSYEEWTNQLKIFSFSTIRRAVKKLEQLGIITTKMLGRKRSDRTKWYTINYEILSKKIPCFDKNSSVLKMNSSSVHNEQIINKETEITSENKPISSEATVFVKHEKLPQRVNVVQKETQFENKNNLAIELLGIWNQLVGEGSTLAQLTKKRAQHLVAAFKFKFESNLEIWKKFCKQITTSDFLMGRIKETFRASLDWVLKFEVIQRILEGDFGVKVSSLLDGIPSHSCEENALEEMTAEIDSKIETIEVKELRKKILHRYGLTLYKSWFHGLIIQLDQEGRELKFQTSSLFVRDWIQTNYFNDIQRLSSKIIHIFYTTGC